MKIRFEDRIAGFALPPTGAGEAPGISAIEPGPDGWKLTRRSLMALLAAGAFAGLPRPAARQFVGPGAFAHEILLDSLSFFPNGQTLVSAGRDSLVKFWTVPEGALFRVLPLPSSPHTSGREPGRKLDRRGDGCRRPRTLAGRRRDPPRVGGTHGRGQRSCLHPGQQPTGIGQPGSHHQGLVRFGCQAAEQLCRSTDVMLQAAVPRSTERNAPRLVSLRVSGRAAARLLITAGGQLHLRPLSTGAIHKTVRGQGVRSQPRRQLPCGAGWNAGIHLRFPKPEPARLGSGKP